VTYSYTQIREYLIGPRRYRHHYLGGWYEKEDSAASLFGRAFEKALSAYFLHQDHIAVLLEEWRGFRGDLMRSVDNRKWEDMLQQGIELLVCFAENHRVRIPHPRRNLNIRVRRRLSSQNDFVSYLDGIGYLDDTRSVLEWKTTSSRYPEQPAGLLALDPQLICYSWMTGIAEVSLICFVRKRVPEIQYLSAVISEEQRSAYRTSS
jgi:hypothetical protein